MNHLLLKSVNSLVAICLLQLHAFGAPAIRRAVPSIRYALPALQKATQSSESQKP